MNIDAKNLDYKGLNEALRRSEEKCTVTGCMGQRFIAAGMSDKSVKLYGVPGNALGAYLNGASLEVFGNAQDAVGDTMNDGKIVVYGNAGDTVGYAMRGGKIFVRGNIGYRAGIHMKAYKDKLPVMVIGGGAGSFLGEYQAGGIIIVLGLGVSDRNIIGNFPCTGMHGGKMFLRSDCRDVVFPKQVHCHIANYEEKAEICDYVTEFCDYFAEDLDEIMNATFTVVTPDSKNPYKQMYIAN